MPRGPRGMPVSDRSPIWLKLLTGMWCWEVSKVELFEGVPIGDLGITPLVRSAFAAGVSRS